MIEVQNIPTVHLIFFFLQIVFLLIYLARLKKHKNQTKALRANVKKSEDFINTLQKNSQGIQKKEEVYVDFFRTFPSLIKKLTSYNEKREVLEITAKGINHLLKPKRSYIFIAKENSWIALSKIDSTISMRGPQCGKTEGILGVTYDLRDRAIDEEALNTLSPENKNRILQDPLRGLAIQVCAPIFYEDQFYGIMALSGIPNYSKQEKILLEMLGEITGSAIFNSINYSKIKNQAHNDHMTGLSNKRFFEDKIQKAILKETRDKGYFSVFMFDIDHFKNFNDTNGHQAGDEALKTTANLIKESFRSGDVRARYGGEEFIILMNGATKEQAYASAERFRAKVEKYPYPHEKNQPKGILTISGGVATYPDDGDSSKDIIEEADKALYQAKESGRNKVGMAQSIDFSSDGLDLQEEDASMLQRQR